MDGANAEADPQAMAAIRAEVFMVIEVLVDKRSWESNCEPERGNACMRNSGHELSDSSKG